ncbi:MAG: penicillin-binding protein 1C [Treponema sp.]|nr:penicillin-binding protein 1C [Treponema sp.]
MRRYVFVLLVIAFIFSLPRQLFNVSYSPVLYDREGRLLGAKVAADGQWRFPAADTINEKFSIALIEAEDRRFRRHLGVDPLAISRAMIQNISNKRIVSGGSTITMQTIRLSRGMRKRNIFEKSIEAILALRLEIGRSKDDILALYAANAPFGANVVGLEAAAWRWFGRSSEDLSWAEAAVLAVLPNNPAMIHPGRNRETLKNKRDALLEKLLKNGHIDNETYFLSIAEPLPGEPLALPRFAPHLLERFVLSSGSAAFKTTLDRDIQERTSVILNRAGDRFAFNGIFNGACIVMNTRTGEVFAYVGNTLTHHAPDVDINISWRSSGSLLKPFLFAAMLDSGDITHSSFVSDIPTRIGSFSPENITRNYLGVIPADDALARSLNVPAARMLRTYGVDRFTQLLRSLGLTTLFRSGNDYGLPLVLGGAEVTLFEITGLYAGLGRAVNANSGTTANEIFFTPIVNIVTPVNRSNSSQRTARQTAGRLQRQTAPPVSAGAAWLTLEALAYAARPGEEAIWQEYAGARHIAWKTGTSFGLRDAWAIGVTPEWTVGVWIGNASGEGRPELRSTLTAAPVMFEIFSMLDSAGGNRGTWFFKPTAQLRSEETCASSGFPASINCAEIKFTDMPLNAPAVSACRYCHTIDGQKWFILTPAEEWYYRRWNLDYRPLPASINAHGIQGRGGGVLALFNPEPESQVYVPRELDGTDGKIVFSAAHRNDSETIHWHLDTQYLGFTRTFHEIEARPEPGYRTLTLVDSAGNTIQRSFYVLNTQ